mgnify:CR=1 FL=1
MTDTIIRAVDLLFRIMEYAILARVIISWIPIPRDNQFIRLLYQITEPILGPIRSMIQRSAMGRNMMIDFSPIIAFILIGLIRNIIVNLLIRGL